MQTVHGAYTNPDFFHNDKRGGHTVHHGSLRDQRKGKQ